MNFRQCCQHCILRDQGNLLGNFSEKFITFRVWAETVWILCENLSVGLSKMHSTCSREHFGFWKDFLKCKHVYYELANRRKESLQVRQYFCFRNILRRKVINQKFSKMPKKYNRRSSRSFEKFGEGWSGSNFEKSSKQTRLWYGTEFFGNNGTRALWKSLNNAWDYR